MRFLDLTKHRWTVFWQQLGINIPPRYSKVKTFKWSNCKTRLRKAGVEDAPCERLNELFSQFQEPPLQIIRFCQFFIQDRDLIHNLYSSASISIALETLVAKFTNDDHERVRQELERIRIFRGLEQKGHGERYMSELSAAKRPDEFNCRRLQYLLARHPKLNPVKYRLVPPARLAGWLVFPIRKTIGRQLWFIYLQLKLGTDGRLLARMTVDSEYERRLVLSEISDWWGSFIHGIEETVDFNPLLDFVRRTGQSKSFSLDSVSFIDGDYVLTVENKFRRFRPGPMVPHRYLKLIKGPEQLSALVLRHKSEELSGRPLIVPVSTPYNSRVRGAISLRLIDRNIRVRHSETIQGDFLSDFKITLGSFATYGTLKERSFCELFLQNDIRRKSRTGKIAMPLRMPADSDLWKYHRELVQAGIVFPERYLEHSSKYCFNRECNQAFRPQHGVRTDCDGCQCPLYDKTELTTGNISETGIARWLAQQAKDTGCDSVAVVAKKLLGKKLFLVEMVRGDSKQLYLPVTSDWKDQERDVLSRRMPDVFVVTSRGNANDFAKNALAVVALHDLYHDIRFVGKDRLLKYSRKIEEKAIKRVRDRAEEASERLSSDAHYLQLNKAGKNIGAEMFEADCSTLLQYMFGSARWLGASSRGLAVPDGCSAFPCYPSLGIGDGFFVWDSKFTSAHRSKIGSVAKNKVYVASMYKSQLARRAKSRGLLFISNKPEPATFRQAARRIAGKRRVRVAYMRAGELLRVFHHFQRFEALISDKQAAKQLFFGLMDNLLTRTAKKQGGRVLVVSPELLDKIIGANEKALRRCRR